MDQNLLLRLAGGFVIKDWIGRFLQVGTMNLEEASVSVSETTTMRNGVRAAVQTA